MVSLLAMETILSALKFLHPSNLAEEKKKFFEQEEYNPQFTYPKLDFPITDFAYELERIMTSKQHDNKELSQLIQGGARRLHKMAELLEQRGTEKFSMISQELFLRPNNKLVAQAKKDLEKKNELPEERKLGAQEMSLALTQALKENGLDYTIVEEDMPGRVRIDNGMRKIKINPKARFSHKDIAKLTVHELQTHAKRYQNGLQQHIDIFAAGTDHFLETEEGLAIYNEEKEQVRTQSGKNHTALLVLAVDKALNGSFREVYQLAKKYVSQEHAFAIALRVKRGLADTGQVGAYTKDASYYSGWKKVSALSEEDRELLLVGRISFYDIPLIKKLLREKIIRKID